MLLVTEWNGMATRSLKRRRRQVGVDVEIHGAGDVRFQILNASPTGFEEIPAQIGDADVWIVQVLQEPCRIYEMVDGHTGVLSSAYRKSPRISRALRRYQRLTFTKRPSRPISR